MTSPSPVHDLLGLLAASGGRPRITQYDRGGERVELSGAVLANWTAKTTNLLVEEFDVAPGATVRLDLPAHWRTLVWALATWRCGGCVLLGPEPGTEQDADVVVTDHPERHAVPALVAVALPALARRFDGSLPPGAVDAAAAVMTYGDVIGWAPDPDPGRTALVAADQRPSHADLAHWAATGSTAPAGARVLVEPGRDRTADVAAHLRTSLGVLAAGGSLVTIGPDLADELAADPDRRTALLATERVTARG